MPIQCKLSYNLIPREPLGPMSATECTTLALAVLEHNLTMGREPVVQTMRERVNNYFSNLWSTIRRRTE